ncbi:MAG TPA: NAD-dependent epimerase/dehydratase family protein [Gemmatimonadetes bacterium]|jgi:UDP-glucose 4-epimerase|nr:NAD-dependent epimerase/dehydratase family protein [Gemmatimonadota bacterium]HIC15193.1 NAD-dependent epimerase/dehydratase family protein [Gemmatimonadota bacterium]HIN77554.1 NAD-dependent epimerase/dehydratase family protein [Gemmatimonadota bacterium]
MNYSRRRVLVTGGAGFIGSHVADAYLASGDHVWVLDNLSSGRPSNIPEDAEFIELDIRDDDIPNLFREVQFDIVNHHAAQIDVRTSVADPTIDASINLEGLLNLTEAAIEVGTRRFVFVSSGGVIYGEPSAIPTSETAPKMPLSPYGVTKFTGELYLNYYRQVHGLEYVALRYSNVYGPRQDPHGEAGVVSIFSRKLLAGEPLTIFGDGEQTRDYVYVGDVVSANLLASEIDLDVGGQLDDHAFNVGTGIATSVNKLADVLESIAGADLSREHKSGRPGELRHSALNVDRLKSLGWAPGSTLERGLQETYTFIGREMAGATE